MKLKIGYYNVEIKCYTENGRYDKTDTEYFLNNLAAAMGRSYEYLYKHGYNATAEEAREQHHQIYSFLEKRGFYDDTKKGGNYDIR